MKKIAFLVFTTLASFFAPLLQAASDYLLEIDGIKGESRDSAHPGAIEIQSWSWGVSNSGAASGGGGGTGKVSFQDFHFTTRIGKASPQLLLSCATGKHIPKAVLYVRKSGGGQEDYYKITLEDILVSSLTQSASTGAADGSVIPPPVDAVSLNFTKITIEHIDDAGETTVGSATTVAPTAQ